MKKLLVLLIFIPALGSAQDREWFSVSVKHQFIGVVAQDSFFTKEFIHAGTQNRVYLITQDSINVYDYTDESKLRLIHFGALSKAQSSWFLNYLRALGSDTLIECGMLDIDHGRFSSIHVKGSGLTEKSIHYANCHDTKLERIFRQCDAFLDCKRLRMYKD